MTLLGIHNCSIHQSSNVQDEEAEAEAEEQERRRSGRLRVTVLPAQPRPLRNRDAQRDRLPAAQDAEDEVLTGLHALQQPSSPTNTAIAICSTKIHVHAGRLLCKRGQC